MPREETYLSNYFLEYTHLENEIRLLTDPVPPKRKAAAKTKGRR